MKDTILEIMKKKELSDIPVQLVEETLLKILKRNNLTNIPKRKKFRKQIIKETRAELRKYTGMFQIKNKKREKFLNLNELSRLLDTHTSTKERKEIYPEIINLIKQYNPKSILDLGAGLNPLVLAINFKDAKYTAYDIKADEISLLNSFFKKNNLNASASVKDIRKANNLPKADLTLIFKTLDILETKGHKYAQHIMSILDSNYVIVSFSTKTLSGKNMKNIRRAWFESILKSLNYLYEIKIFSNEVFYIVKKNSDNP